MFRQIKKIVRKVWYNTSFKGANVMRNVITGKFLIILIIVGIPVSFMQRCHQQYEARFEANLQTALTEGWKYADNEPYLNVYIPTDNTIPFIWDKEDIISKTENYLNTNNYQVRARKSNRNSGLYVKPDATKEHRVEAIYSENVYVEGEEINGIFLMSDNVEIQDQTLKVQLREKGQKLSLRE